MRDLEQPAPFILAGPTTVGKSEVAKHLADQTGGTIVNADKYYLYASENFTLGLGLNKHELNDGRSRALFGALDPYAPLPSQPEFLGMIDNAVNDLHARGEKAIIEGCSYRFNTALIERYGVENAVCLTWADRDMIQDRMGRRVDELVKQGLYEETERAMLNGYEGTFPMTSMMYRPGIEVIKGNITAEEARMRMVENGFDNAFEHDEWYARIAGLARIVHDTHFPERTAACISAHFEL